ncbi:uncharacterized protein N0V89_008211 [Didymosphaeria variabile]|uniref:Uncharacterized protein n=1 Tax=Didymosphaeria variabile TaxID=1932322 RepID=A0A9W9C7L0_9PLEO|nr:uncharacterized protein N0V89_008211 [Didymosphaeria variabile]KAJ4349595.1 hypothetical protein N0V89_008211 [Didymosphaeria variabile]
MLDEALPTFFLKPSADKVKHHESFYYTQHGSEPEASYSLTSVDPASNDAKNTYAVALFDSHNPDILYGEVLSKPGWTQPSLSQEEIRKNGGVPPPPQPIFPTEFAIQLYNPDQQIIVKQQTTKWSSTISYEFSMPQTSFRTPSSSNLDRTMSDPGADATTPHINFVWRKEGRLGKDMTCYLTGKSTDVVGKKAKKSKEPDIAVALFSGLKEITIMEPNLYRVEMEDYKGLEVVILLGGAVIRDLFFSNARESYHILDPNTRKNSGGIRTRKGSSPLEPSTVMQPVMTPQPPPQPQRPVQRPIQNTNTHPATGSYIQPSRNAAKRTSLPPLETGNRPGPRLDPRRQWELDAETARLREQVEAEAREQRRQADSKRRQLEQEEERKTRQFLEDEDRRRKQDEKERRRRQGEIDRETERLRRQFGDQSNLLSPSQHPQRHSVPLAQGPFHRPVPASQPQRPGPGPYLQPPGAQASQSAYFSNGLPKPNGQQRMRKKSFWGLRSSSESNANTLRKKQSSMF